MDSLNYICDHLHTAIALYGVSGGTISSVTRLMRRDSVQKAPSNDTFQFEVGLGIQTHCKVKCPMGDSTRICIDGLIKKTGWAIVIIAIGVMLRLTEPLILHVVG